MPTMTAPSLAFDGAQTAVLSHGDGALLVTGAAGTGKTSALRERFARLIDEGAEPERVALVLGSRSARDAARALLLDRLPASLPGLQVVTFHGLAHRVLKLREGEPPEVLGAAEQFAKVRSTDHANTPEGQMTMLRELQLALDAKPSRGGELRTSTAVERILVDAQRARGVRLAGGEEIGAGIVFSAADPRHTLLDLVGAAELPPEFAWATQSIKLRGSVAKVHVETDGQHGLPGGTLVVAPTIRYLERAYDAAKYGQISAAPYLEVTSSAPRGGHAIVSIHFQFAPYALRERSWADAGAIVQQRAIDTLAQYAPGFRSSIRRVHTITPHDMQSTYGLSEGDLNHGQLILDQIFFMRPLPAWSNHRTPVDGLYLCGSGVHGGGGISGASGRNAAASIANG